MSLMVGIGSGMTLAQPTGAVESFKAEGCQAARATWAVDSNEAEGCQAAGAIGRWLIN